MINIVWGKRAGPFTESFWGSIRSCPVRNRRAGLARHSPPGATPCRLLPTLPLTKMRHFKNQYGMEIPTSVCNLFSANNSIRAFEEFVKCGDNFYKGQQKSVPSLFFHHPRNQTIVEADKENWKAEDNGLPIEDTKPGCFHKSQTYIL